MNASKEVKWPFFLPHKQLAHKVILLWFFWWKRSGYGWGLEIYSSQRGAGWTDSHLLIFCPQGFSRFTANSLQILHITSEDFITCKTVSNLLNLYSFKRGIVVDLYVYHVKIILEMNTFFKYWWPMPLFLFIFRLVLRRVHFTYSILLRGVVCRLACFGSALTWLWLGLKSAGKLGHPSPMGIDSAHTSQHTQWGDLHGQITFTSK